MSTEDTQRDCRVLAYRAAGSAILAAQLLEAALIPIYEFQRAVTEPGRIKDTGGRVPEGAYKIPTANIVRALSERKAIDPGLEIRLTKYNEARHLLVHRWFRTHGLPNPSDAKYYLELAQHAIKVEEEARALTSLITSYVIKYADPEWAAANPDAYALRIRDLFKDAPLGCEVGYYIPDSGPHISSKCSPE